VKLNTIEPVTAAQVMMKKTLAMNVGRQSSILALRPGRRLLLLRHEHREQPGRDQVTTPGTT